MYLMLLNCTPKAAYHGKFYIVYILPQHKRKRQGNYYVCYGEGNCQIKRKQIYMHSSEIVHKNVFCKEQANVLPRSAQTCHHMLCLNPGTSHLGFT